MPDENTTPAGETKPADQTTPPVGAGTEPGAEGAPAGDKPVDKPEDVPAEVLRAKLTEANAEAANYRTQLREAQAALAKAKTPEEFAAATTELSDKIEKLERAQLVSTVANAHKLPAELAAVLQGADEAALTAHAKVLQKFVAAPAAPDPSELEGGLTPGDGDEDANLSPAELARKYGRR